MAIQSRTDEELKKLALDIFSGHVFTDRHLQDPHDLTRLFMVLNFLNEENLAELRADPPGLIYEYLSEAGPRSVNGLPSFFSMKMLNQADTEKMFKLYEEIKAQFGKLAVPA